MTLSQFSEIFALLAKQLRQVDADEADIRAYFEALKDLEAEFLALSAKQLAATADWFPKTSEWRTAARKVEQDRTDQMRATLRKLVDPLCLACQDTGWAPANTPVLTQVRPCECQRLRRLEILGRRPWPQLPETTPDPTQEATVRQMLAPLVNRHG